MKKETATAAKSNAIFIRRASPEDARVLSAMGELTFTRAYAAIIPAAELADYTSRTFAVGQIESELTAPQITYLLAMAGTTACGYAKLAPTPPPPAVEGAKPVELARLYVLPEWTGKGIGTTLIEKALEAACGQGHGSCWLRVWQGNDRAIEFYRRWGFSQVGSEPYHVGRCTETVLLMIRGLTCK